MRKLKTIAVAAAAVMALTLPLFAQETQGGPQPVEVAAVEVTAQPMVYVTARTSMDPKDIEQVMNAAFETLGAFLGETQVAPLGPPLAIYSNWTESQMTIDVGFPVSASDAQKAKGDVLSGSTPSGHALKAIHRGSYDGLAATYAAIEAQMQQAGIIPGGLSWEIYMGEPGVTPDAELVTEIYMTVSAEDAAKLPDK